MTITNPKELREARLKARLSQRKLEQMTGIDRHAIGALERGIPAELITALNDALSCAKCGAEVTTSHD